MSPRSHQLPRPLPPLISLLWGALVIAISPAAILAEGPAPNAAAARGASPPPPACSTPKWGAVRCIRQESFAKDTCTLIEAFATRHGLNVGFFARLVWQESRFDPNAISHAGAEGIAQFMPFTARKRGLRDAFNPAEALDHSAEYLAEMTRKFGNLGLAAIGYNAGEHRVKSLLEEGQRPPPETRAYVQIITGMRYDQWVGDKITPPDLRLDRKRPFVDACVTMAAARKLSAPPRRTAKALQFAPGPDAPVYSTLAPMVSVYPKLRPKRIAPWGVQLAFGTSNASALRKFKQATRRCRTSLSGETPDLIPVKNRIAGRKGFVMARIGRNSLKAARKLCQRLAASGCACRVYRNEK